MHDGGGGFSGGGGHDGGGFFGGGHHGGHDAGGGFGAGGHHGEHGGAGGHHHHQSADFRPSDLVSPTDPVYGKRYGRQASGSRGGRPASATGRVAMCIVLLAVFAFIIFVSWQVFAAS